MTQQNINKRRAYSRDEMLSLKEIVAEGYIYFITKYPVNMPLKCRVRTKNVSTCSTHNEGDVHDFRGSKSSLTGGSREQSDTEDLANNGWRRVANNRGSTQNSHLSQQQQQPAPLWRQRTTSGSDSHPRGRGGFFNNASSGRGRGAFSFGNSDHQQNFKNDSNFKSARGGGQIARGFGRGRGATTGSFNRNSCSSDHSNENGNFRHSYHAPGDSNQAHETFWNEDDWVDESTIAKTANSEKQTAPPPGLNTEPANPEPEQPIWIYIDPQEKVQGPFTSNAMSQWLELGYLPKNLKLRRVTEPNFISLDHLISTSGLSDPFKEAPVPVPVPAPVVVVEKPAIAVEPVIPDTLALISKFSPKEVETHFVKFAESRFSNLGDPMQITEALLKQNMADIFRCLSDENFLSHTIEQLQLTNVTLTSPPELCEDQKPGKITFKKCAMNEGADGFHFEIDTPSPGAKAQEQQQIDALSEQFKENAKLSSEAESLPSSATTAAVQDNDNNNKTPESKKSKKKRRTSGTTAGESVNATPTQVVDDEISVEKGWISAPTKLPKAPITSTDTATSASGKKKKKTKKSEAEAKTEAWEAEMNRRKQEKSEKLEQLLAEETEYKEQLLQLEREAQQERMSEAQQAIHNLQNREQRWQNTNLNLTKNPSSGAPPGMPNKAPTNTGAVPNFAQIQAEQLAEEARMMEIKLKQLQGMSQKASTNALKPTGWASVVAAANPTPAVSLAPVVVNKKVAKPPKEVPVISSWSNNNVEPAPKKANGFGTAVNTTTKGRSDELRLWCQNQLSNLPPINSAIDLPTVTSLVCDMTEKGQVTEFIENSFGNSKKVKKFVQDLMQRKAKSST